MAFPEPIWFLEDARLAVATEMPRVCVSCADPIVRESSMSTPDGWIHTRCRNAERARLWARRTDTGSKSWHLMRPDFTRSECGNALPYLGHSPTESWERLRQDNPPEGRICRECSAMVRGDEKALQRMRRSKERSFR